MQRRQPAPGMAPAPDTDSGNTVTVKAEEGDSATAGSVAPETGSSPEAPVGLTSETTPDLTEVVTEGRDTATSAISNGTASPPEEEIGEDRQEELLRP